MTWKVNRNTCWLKGAPTLHFTSYDCTVTIEFLHLVLGLHCSSSSSSVKLFTTGFLRLQDGNIQIIKVLQSSKRAGPLPHVTAAMCIIYGVDMWHVTWAQSSGLRSGYEAARWSPAGHPAPSEVSSCCSRVSLSLPLPRPAASSVLSALESTERAVYREHLSETLLMLHHRGWKP